MAPLAGDTNIGDVGSLLLTLEIFMPTELDYQKYKILQKTAEDCPVKLNIEDSVDIKLNWYQTKI